VTVLVTRHFPLILRTEIARASYRLAAILKKLWP
jgi:hypothetical protein